jgi:hypothetical protein
MGKSILQKYDEADLVRMFGQINARFMAWGYKYWLLVLVAGIGSLATAQDAIKLNMSDVYFQWKPMPKGSVMCGYAIFGNHFGNDDPRVEWDIYVDEIVQGNDRVAGVSAGTFLAKGKTRTPPRAPITEITFKLEGDPNPILTNLVGAPNQSNGIRATLDLGRAAELFDAFSNEQSIAATLKYSDGTSDLLTFNGFRDSRKFGRGKNSLFDECLRGRTPRLQTIGMYPIP